MAATNHVLCMTSVNLEIYFYFFQMDGKKVLVTGGTGLVGMAIRKIVETEEKRDDEEWVFLSSKDCDLR